MDLVITQYSKVTEHPNPSDFSKHTHDDYEIYCFLEGDATYFVEGTRYSLLPGDLILIRKGEIHLIQILSQTRYERIGVNFDLHNWDEIDPDGMLLRPFLDRPLGVYNHYPSAMFPDNRWVSYIREIGACEDVHQRLCYLLPLLCDLSRSFDVLKKNACHAEISPVSAIIAFIHAHLGDDLSLSMLEDHFFTSKTHLNRLFKQATGTTVWEYITVKRLFLARELMQEGKAPNQVFQQCGFKDYSTFFRAYKQHFGVSPKKSLRQNHLNYF